ncbi:MAG TPA: hypothetical protein VNY52_00620 [Solirubrobacteraceae bacterium]|nr:hypothetical protein [Solirubrobacteraceae bacterium]
MGNLIKIYSKVRRKEVLTHLALIDLGTEKAKDLDIQTTAVTPIIEALEEMANANVDPCINLLVISHQDKDHWSLLPRLQDDIGKKIANFQLGRVVTGGLGWGDTASAAVEAFAAAFNRKTEPFLARHTDYDYPNPIGELFNINGISFRTLIVNARMNTKRTRTSGSRNTTSAVIVLETNHFKCIFPGDATVQTISAVNQIVHKYPANPLLPCHVLSVPHHGALPTLASNYRNRDPHEEPNLDVARVFANSLQAEILAASAGFFSKYEHPSELALEVLAVGVIDWELHNYVQFSYEKNCWDEVPQTLRSVYTTIVRLNPKAGEAYGETWEFTITAAGQVSRRLVKFGRPAPYPAPRLVALPSERRAATPSSHGR